MMGMTSLMMITICIMMMMISPMKMSFTLVVVSLWVAATSYTHTTTVFPSCVVLISFSTGMMILFYYCSTLSEYETKTSPLKMAPALLCSILALGYSSCETSSLSPLKKCMLELNTPMLILMMGMVLCSMVCVNMTLIDPSKPLMSSY